MTHASDPTRELPTKRRQLIADDETFQRFRRLALSTGLTSNLTLHALLDCYDVNDEPVPPLDYINMRSGLPTKTRSVIADDETYQRFRKLAHESYLTSNLTLSMLLDCYDARGGPIRVEGAGLRIPCDIDAPCAPDGPSAGPMQVIHVDPTRRREDRLSADELRRRIAAANAAAAQAREHGARLRTVLLEAAATLGPD